jgi:hypothetical protein
MLTQLRVGRQPGTAHYTGWSHCLRTIVEEEGVAALWKGSLPRVMQVGVSSALWLGFYSLVRERLRERQRQRERGDARRPGRQSLRRTVPASDGGTLQPLERRQVRIASTAARIAPSSPCFCT